MSVVITLEDLRAYSEVDYIINHINIRYKEKVPKKIISFFSEMKDPNYQVKINPYIPLQNQGLKEYALQIIALLHLKYWCEDEERKKELYNIMLHNQEKLEEQMKEKFGDNTFEKQENDDTTYNEIAAQDFSRPKPVQRYNQYAQVNTDIQDYTDVVEEENSNKNIDLSLDNKEKENIFVKIKNIIVSIFSKNKQTK